MLIVPGIIWSIKFRFFPYFILQGFGPVESLKKSGQLTYGSKWNLFFFAITSGVIAIIGFLALLLGLFWAIPVVWIANAFIFIKLSENFNNDITSDKI